MILAYKYIFLTSGFQTLTIKKKKGKKTHSGQAQVQIWKKQSPQSPRATMFRDEESEGILAPHLLHIAQALGVKQN